MSKTAMADSLWDPEHPDPAKSSAHYTVFNIGNGNPVKLLDMIGTLEREPGIVAIKDMLPIQPGDVEVTAADLSRIGAHIGFRPSTPLKDGIRDSVAWFLNYYNSPDNRGCGQCSTMSMSQMSSPGQDGDRIVVCRSRDFAHQ